MDDPDPFEPGTHVFIGTIRTWGSNYGELVTDSGVTIPLVTQGHSPIPQGVRITISARKYRPLYRVEKIYKAD